MVKLLLITAGIVGLAVLLLALKLILKRCANAAFIVWRAWTPSNVTSWPTSPTPRNA